MPFFWLLRHTKDHKITNRASNLYKSQYLVFQIYPRDCIFWNKASSREILTYATETSRVTKVYNFLQKPTSFMPGNTACFATIVLAPFATRLFSTASALQPQLSSSAIRYSGSRLGWRKPSVIMANNNDDDLFGDDSFLADFDVDAAVRQSQPTPSTPATASGTPARNPYSSTHANSANKRLKTTTNPYHSSSSPTALHATTNSNQRRSYHQTSKSPFPPNSKITIGTKTDLKELQVNNGMSSRENVDPQEAVPPQQNNHASPVTLSTSSTTVEIKSPATLPSSPSPPFTPNSKHARALEQTLQKYFGFSTYRQGQLDVLEGLAYHQKDTAVFWATGSGKSLCYQIPPLHTGRVGIVVSPLISLMQDQVNKLNGLSEGGNIATFLGSGQLDPQEESKALQGLYSLVYITPEKLMSNGFLDQLASMHQYHKPICLIAIDESHCVSEWGHDFRPEYRLVGKALRSNPILNNMHGEHDHKIPLLALTATAIPRVQKDICTSLQLVEPQISRQSFDRKNLNIQVFKKKAGSYRTALQPLVEALQKQGSSSGGQSTIIYVPSKNLTDEIAMYLSRELSKSTQHQVEAYHAGLSTEVRSRAHMNFLVGRTTVIVATVAFGMGIDKPDTRRVVHFGPPKTVEEYYQQIGRAGRDGLQAECIMHVTENDFDKYKGDFYLGGLSGAAKDAAVESMDALRKFAFDTDTCRRKALLDFFDETPSFGERCGTCDNCKNHVRYGADNERDFGPLGARVVLQAIAALNEQPIGTIEKVIAGSKVEDYRYNNTFNATSLSEKIKDMRSSMERKRTKEYFREMIAPLVSKGYLYQGTKSQNVGGARYSRTWGTYRVTPTGSRALNNPQIPILLPVPPSLREVERVEEEKRLAVLAQLEDAGVKLDGLPKEEFENGEGEVISAYKKWYSKLDAVRKTNEERATQLEDLCDRIQKWRSQTAEKLQVAPATVLAEHVVASIAYTVATMPAGCKVERDALVTAGVRTRAVDTLVVTIGQWIDEFHTITEEDNSKVYDGAEVMVLTSQPFVPPNGPWEYAVYRPNKKTGMATWESSSTRFANGETVQAISMAPENGKAIQVKTVIGHCWEGLIQGRPTPLHRLAEISSPPTKVQWDRLQECEIESGIDVTEDPSTCNHGERFTMTAFLDPIMGADFASTPYEDRSREDHKKFSEWCDALKWYMALKRVGYEPKFRSLQ